jgi:hypothetical protein
MSKHTSTGKGLHTPHKHEAAKPGIGATLNNAKGIASSEKTPKVKAGTSGVAHTYYGNSRSAVHANFDKHPHD